MLSLLFQSWHRTRISRGHLSPQLERPLLICISSYSTHSQRAREDHQRQSDSYFPSTILGTTVMVSLSVSDVSSASLPPSDPSRSPNSEQRNLTPPTATSPAPNSLARCWFYQEELQGSDQVEEVLLHSRKLSTHTTYLQKWCRFLSWCSNKNLDPAIAPLHKIFDYILSLKDAGLALASLKVHRSAITSFHQPVEGWSIFAHPITRRFIKGLSNLFPPRSVPPPSWNLELVLDTLTRAPFEPLATCPQSMTLKVVFLLAITSARRVSELAALLVVLPYTIFNRDNIILHSHPSFIAKVCSDFHVNEPIVLPSFYPKPHSTTRHTIFHLLGIHKALAFYIDRTPSFLKSDRLLISTIERTKGHPLSSQRISKLIVSCITQCYTLRNKPLPQTPRAHSTRAVATSTAFLHEVPLKDICRVATWSTNDTFMKHCAISQT